MPHIAKRHLRFKREERRPLPRIQSEEAARRIPPRRMPSKAVVRPPRIQAPERPVPMPRVRSPREHEQIEKVKKKVIEKALRERGFDPSAPRVESEADVRRRTGPPPSEPQPGPRTRSREAIFDPKDPIRVESEADVREKTGRLPERKKRGLFDYLND